MRKRAGGQVGHARVQTSESMRLWAHQAGRTPQDQHGALSIHAHGFHQAMTCRTNALKSSTENGKVNEKAVPCSRSRRAQAWHAPPPSGVGIPLRAAHARDALVVRPHRKERARNPTARVRPVRAQPCRKSLYHLHPPRVADIRQPVVGSPVTLVVHATPRGVIPLKRADRIAQYGNELRHLPTSSR